MDIVLAPDIYVNASVALDSPPEHVVRRALTGPHKTRTSTWVLERVESMLRAAPQFRDEAVEAQMQTIRGLVTVVDTAGHFVEDWQQALVSLAKTAGVDRVLTDHPDLLETGSHDGVTFVSSEVWLSEQATPPPPPTP